MCDDTDDELSKFTAPAKKATRNITKEPDMKTIKSKPPAVVAAKAPPETGTESRVKFNGNVMEGISPEHTNSQNMAALTTRATTAAAFTIRAYSTACHEAEEFDIADALQQAGAEVVGGDLGRVEKMLTSQAIALDNIFNNLALRSANQSTYKGIEVLLRLALKAQAQSRATAEALAEIKNPRPVTFVKQANMAQGHQQVNNSYPGAPALRVEDSQSEQTKLLEVNHGQRLDIGAQTASIRVNQAVEAVGAVNRPQVC